MRGNGSVLYFRTHCGTLSGMYTRTDSRQADEMRKLQFELGVAPQALASVLVSFGNTKVICAVSLEESVPGWMKAQGVSGGWLTAEYSMLPYSTPTRKKRSSGGKIDGRAVEIQRLIGRSLRAVVDLDALGERTIWVDCDVLQADGGTRTASISGAAVALQFAFRRLVQEGVLPADPMRQLVSAVSVGKVEGEPILDLCYIEDCAAQVDMNVVITEGGEYVEVQGSGEEATFSPPELTRMLELADIGASQILKAQRDVLGSQS